jgi:hypothetical protein
MMDYLFLHIFFYSLFGILCGFDILVSRKKGGLFFLSSTIYRKLYWLGFFRKRGVYDGWFFVLWVEMFLRVLFYCINELEIEKTLPPPVSKFVKHFFFRKTGRDIVS